MYGCEKYMIKQSKKEHPAAFNVYFSVSVFHVNGSQLFKAKLFQLLIQVVLKFTEI